MRLFHSNKPKTDLLITLGAIFALCVVYGAFTKGLVMGAQSPSNLIVLTAIGLGSLAVALSPLLLAGFALLVLASAALANPIPSVVRVPVLLGCSYGFFSIAATTGIFAA